MDSDVERLLRAAMQRARKSFKQALNDALRVGLRAKLPSRELLFEIKARVLTLREGTDPARLQEIDDELEIAEFIRKSEALPW